MTTPAMKWGRFDLDGGLGKWKSNWDKICEHEYQGHPLYDSRFSDSLLKHFGTGDERLLVATERNEVVGMTILQPSGMGRWESFLPSQAQIAPVLAARPDVLDRTFDGLPKSAWLVSFLNQDPAYAANGPFEARGSKAVRPHAVTMHIDLVGTFSAYWHSRSKNLQKNLKRYGSRAARANMEPSLRLVTRATEMKSAVSRYSKLEMSGWKGEAGTAVSIGSSQEAFYAEVLQDFAATGQGRVYELHLGKTLCASRLVIVGAKVVVILKTAYDEAMKEFAPGRQLLQRLIEREFVDSQGKRLEFYTNATSDQLAWSTGKREISHVSLFRWDGSKRAYEWLHRIRAPRSSAGSAPTDVASKSDGD